MMDNFMANQVMLAYAATQVATKEPSEDSEQGTLDSTVVSEKTNKGNNLPFWGNQQTMNLNPLIWTNITGSPYFKVNLFGFKTYHEVIDEIYYKVSHLEPWERGSRKTSGQTGMCGGVRGVGAGGIVSSAYCLLYKLFTLKLTRKQVNGMLNHCDSPYIRGLGFMYVRYTQPPGDLWSWFEGYLDDEEEIDCKAGGGKLQTIGEMCQQMLTKLEWFDTRFPRIPVSTQKLVDEYMQSRYSESNHQHHQQEELEEEVEEEEVKEKYPKYLPASHENVVIPSSHERRDSSKSKRHRRSGSIDKSPKKRSRERKRSPFSRHHHHKSSKSRRRSSSRERHRRHKSKKDTDRSRTPDYQDELRRYSEHRKKSKSRRRSRSRDRR